MRRVVQSRAPSVQYTTHAESNTATAAEVAETSALGERGLPLAAPAYGSHTVDGPSAAVTMENDHNDQLSAGGVALDSAATPTEVEAFGERLHPLVVRWLGRHPAGPEHAGRLTGMLLEMPSSDIEDLLSRP